MLLKGIIGLVLDLSDHFGAAGQRCFHRFYLESVDQGSRVSQCIDGIAEFIARLADLHSQQFSLIQGVIGGSDAVFQLLEIGVQGACGLLPGNIGAVFTLPWHREQTADSDIPSILSVGWTISWFP